jgi:cysteine desulfurase
MPELIYLDHAATTPLSRYALDAMMPYLTGEYGNPSSIYLPGRKARIALDNAREKIAAAFGAHPDEIYFTSGGTESDNWVIHAAERFGGKGRKLVVSSVEHHAVLRPAEEMQNRGFELSLLPVDRSCRVLPETLHEKVDETTALVSVMAANNEVGTIMPIAELAAAAHEVGAWFHTDAVQAAGHIPLNVDELGVDMMSFSAHKFGGPKGIGGLYIRRRIRAGPGQLGGGQERGLRAGTENVAGAVGMAAALEESCRRMEENASRIAALRDSLIRGILQIPGASLTGDADHRLPGNASFLFEGASGEAIVFLLDRSGICASSGSACSAGALEPSHVLLAMGYTDAAARSSLRLTLGEENTEDDVSAVLKILPGIISRLRSE